MGKDYGGTGPPAGDKPARRKGSATMLVKLRRLAVWLMLAATVAGCAGGASGSRPARQDSTAQRSASAFLAAYVRPDGRVARPDQGNDTVSEGQAYGLLLAEVASEPAVFGRIWQWTQDHLQLPGGLFAYHADAAGHLLSTQPASDADLLIAWALLRYQGPDAAERHKAGQQVAAAVLRQEVTTGPGEMPVLTAGTWATGRQASLDPSYWALPALTGLARLTGNQQWQQLADGAVTLTNRLTASGRDLPPDWAQLIDGGALAPAPAPNGSEPQAEYGLDAQRTVVWFAVSCDPRARALAGRWWALLRQPGRARGADAASQRCHHQPGRGPPALGSGGSRCRRGRPAVRRPSAAAARQRAAAQPPDLLRRGLGCPRSGPAQRRAGWRLLSGTPSVRPG